MDLAAAAPFAIASPATASAPARQRIACIVPAYNEERFIAAVIASVPAIVDCIIVVNDASRDRTSEIVRGLNDPRVTLIDHAANKGVGGAMISGYRKALELGADVAVKIDGDGQMDPSDMKRLVGPVLRGEADYAKGVRFRDSDVLRHMPLPRLVGNLGLSFLTKIASGYWNIFDPTNGYTALGRDALEAIRYDRLSNGYFFESSMLINLYRIEAVVRDVPMRAHYGSEQSKLSLTKAFVSFPGYLLKALIKRILWRYFIRDFNACSAFMVCGFGIFSFGLVWGLWHWIDNAMRGVETPSGTVMIAAVSLILGFQLLLQAVVLDVENVPSIPLRNHREDVPENTALGQVEAIDPQKAQRGGSPSAK